MDFSLAFFSCSYTLTFFPGLVYKKTLVKPRTALTSCLMLMYFERSICRSDDVVTCPWSPIVLELCKKKFDEFE